MIKFLKKHKYTSLVAGALAIAVVSGAGGAFIHKKYTYPDVLRAGWRQSGLGFSRIFDMWDQCHHKTGIYASTTESNDLTPHKSTSDEDSNQIPQASSLSATVLEGQPKTTVVSVEFEDKVKEPHEHDHKDGSCCESCAKGLPCESKTKKAKQEQKDTNVKASLSGGSMYARMPRRNPQLRHIQPPSLESSNRGIDLSLGEFRFVDPKELIEKIKAIVPEQNITNEQALPTKQEANQ